MESDRLSYKVKYSDKVYFNAFSKKTKYQQINIERQYL